MVLETASIMPSEVCFRLSSNTNQKRLRVMDVICAFLSLGMEYNMEYCRGLGYLILL